MRRFSLAAAALFAADGLELGVRDSFLKHAAPEGVVFARFVTMYRPA